MYINTISTHHRFSNNLSCKVITMLLKICLFQSVLLSWTQICSTYFVLFVFTPGFTCRSVGREEEVIQNVNETICVWCTVFSQSSFFWRLCFFHLYFRFVSEENVLMSHLDIYSLNVYFRGPLWEKKKTCEKCFEFLLWLWLPWQPTSKYWCVYLQCSQQNSHCSNQEDSLELQRSLQEMISN